MKSKFKKSIGPNVKTPILKPDKGLKGGHCNVTACQEPGAYYYNKSTRKYYCKYCADRINWPGGRAEVMELFGTPLLCELDPGDVDPNEIDTEI